LQLILAAVMLKYGRLLLSVAKMQAGAAEMFIFLSMIADESSMRRCDEVDDNDHKDRDEKRNEGRREKVQRNEERN